MARSTIDDSQLKQLVTANKVALSALDIDGASAIGEALADADLFIVDNGAGGTNRKVTAATMQDYFSSLDVLETSASANYQILFADDNTDTPYSESSSGVSVGRVQGSTLSSSTTSILFSPELGVSLSGGAILGFKDSSGNRLAFTVSSSAASDATSITVSHLSAASTVSSLSVSSLSSIVSLTAGSAGSGDGKVRVDGSGLLYNPSTDLLTVGGDISVGDDILMASNSAVLSMGASADVTFTHDGSAGLAIAAGGAFDIDAAGALTLDGASITIGGDSDVAVDFDSAAFDLDASGAITIDGSAGLSIDSTSTSVAANLSHVGAAGVDLTIAASSSSLNLTGGEADAAAVRIQASASAGGIDIDAGSAGIAVDTTGTIDMNGVAIDIDGSGAMTLDTSDTSNGIKIGVATSGVPIVIGHGTSEVTVGDNLTVSGDLTVSGTTTTVNSTVTTIADPLIELGTGTSGSPSNDLGLVFERGSADNAAIFFDESDDVFAVGTGSFTGASTGNLSHSLATFRASKLEIDGTGNHIEISTDMVVTAAADIKLAPGGGNVLPSADSTDSLGAPATLDSSASSFSAFQVSRLQESLLTSSTSSLTFSPEAGFTANAGDVVIFTDGSSDKLAFEFSSAVGSSNSSASVTVNSSNSTVSSMSKSSIASVSRKQLVSNAWLKLHVDDIDLDGQGRLDLDGDQDTSIRSSADDQIDFEVGGSDVLVLTDGSLVLKGSTPKLTIGDAGEEDTMLVFDGSDEDYRIGIDDGTNILEIGSGASHGSQIAIKIDGSENVDVASHDASSVGLKLGGTLVSASAAELNIMDGDTSASSVTLAAADRLVVNDDGTMKQVAMTAISTFLSGAGLTQASGGSLSINVVRDNFIQSTATSGNTVCALSAEPINEAAVDVYLNGVLQIPAGSQSPGDPSEVDYTYGGSEGSRTVTFADALLSSDVVTIKYIAKSE